MKRLVERHKRHPAARYRGKHLARHHRDVHLRAGAVLGARGLVRRRSRDARHARASISASRCRSSTHMGASGVVAAVAASRGDIGLVPAAGGSGAWWTALEGDDAPKIIARLPFVERADHPAGLPVFGIARPEPGRARDRRRDLERACLRLGPGGGARARSINGSDRSAGPRLRRRGAARLGAAGAHRRARRSCWLRPARRCARRLSSAAMRGVIRSPPKAPGRPAADVTP